jgi:thioredoxin 1
MTSGCTKRRAFTVVAIVAATATRMTTRGFTAVGTVSTRPQAKAPSNLFAANDSPDSAPKLTIETITDANIDLVLSPPSSPGRPVLVDVFAPWCGPCKILDKVLKKSQPKYLGSVDFVKWNVNEKENTVELKKIFLDSGNTLTKLPSLIVFRNGKVEAVRPGLANENQLDDFLERTLPDVLDRTFDDDGVKMVPLPEEAMMRQEEEEAKMAERVAAEANKEDVLSRKAAAAAAMVEEAVKQTLKSEEDCIDERECWQRVEQTLWQNRTVVPAMDGIMMPGRP